MAGCAAGTVKEIRTEPADTLRVAVDQNYQRVYKNLIDKMSECMGEGQVGLFANMRIKSDIFSDLREARVSYMMTNLGTQSYYLHVDIQGDGPDKSVLTAFVAYSTWRHVLPKIEMWATDPGAACEIPAQ